MRNSQHDEARNPPNDAVVKTREVLGSTPGQVKADTVSPTARHNSSGCVTGRRFAIFSGVIKHTWTEHRQMDGCAAKNFTPPQHGVHLSLFVQWNPVQFVGNRVIYILAILLHNFLSGQRLNYNGKKTNQGKALKKCTTIQ